MEKKLTFAAPLMDLVSKFTTKSAQEQDIFIFSSWQIYALKRALAVGEGSVHAEQVW